MWRPSVSGAHWSRVAPSRRTDPPIAIGCQTPTSARASVDLPEATVFGAAETGIVALVADGAVALTVVGRGTGFFAIGFYTTIRGSNDCAGAWESTANPNAPTQWLEQAELLGAITEEPGRLTRTYLTPQHRAAGNQIIAWMREAGSFERMWNRLG